MGGNESMKRVGSICVGKLALLKQHICGTHRHSMSISTMNRQIFGITEEEEKKKCRTAFDMNAINIFFAVMQLEGAPTVRQHNFRQNVRRTIG